MEPVIEAIVFDLGGVLIDWKPEYLYRKIFASEAEMQDFLSGVCTPEWNEQQDAGRSLQEGTGHLVKIFPHYEKQINAFYDRWEEMLGGAIDGTVEILRCLKEKKNVSLYALTNWSAETFPIALERFEFLHWFQGIVVSGAEKSRKPFLDFYHLIITRYHLSPARTLFIDDNLRNIQGASEAGFQTIHFTSPGQLTQSLKNYRFFS